MATHSVFPALGFTPFSIRLFRANFGKIEKFIKTVRRSILLIKWKRLVLFCMGLTDERVPTAQAFEFYQALKKQNKPGQNDPLSWHGPWLP